VKQQPEFYRLFHKLRDFSEQLSGENPNPILYICAALRSIFITEYNRGRAKAFANKFFFSYATFNPAATLGYFGFTQYKLGLASVLPRFLFIPYLVQWSETMWEDSIPQ